MVGIKLYAMPIKKMEKEKEKGKIKPKRRRKWKKKGKMRIVSSEKSQK